MKRVLLILVCSLLGMIAVKAQQIGIRGGLNLSTLSASQDLGSGVSVEANQKCRFGYRLGLILATEQEKLLNLETGLYLTSVGTRSKGSEGGKKITEVDKILYLQLPVLFRFDIVLTQTSKWQLFFGPYGAYGLSAKSKLKADKGTVTVNLFKKIETGEWFKKKEDPLLKRFDAGLTFGTGILVKKLFVGVMYDLGLTNIANRDEIKIKTRNCSINVGWNF